MHIRGIDFVAYQVTDLERAIDFYQNTLGLTLESRWESVYAEFDVGGTAFGLYASSDAPRHPFGVVAFNVESMDDAVAELNSRGLECKGIENTPVCRMGFFTDPDGNEFMLHELLKRD